jgi:restriction endonuclease S subunit
MSWKIEKLGNVVAHRKEFITIDNSFEYKRCRVQVNRKGVILRDIVKGIAINTKKQQVCKEGDFLVAEIDAKVGGYGFVPKELEGAIVSSHYFLFEVDESKLLKDYLAWLIKTDIIQDQITSKGSTNYAAIRPHHVLNFEIPLPLVGEQAVIVHRLNNINDEYSLLDKELDQQQTYLQRLRQTILQEAVQGKLTKQDPTDEPATELLKRIKAEKEKLIKAGKLKKEKELPPITKDEIPFKLPEGWGWCRLGEVIELISGQHVEAADWNDKNNGYPYLTGPSDFGDVNPIFARWTKKPKVFAMKEDVLITVKGSGVGKLNLLHNQNASTIWRFIQNGLSKNVTIKSVKDRLPYTVDYVREDVISFSAPTRNNTYSEVINRNDFESVIDKLKNMKSFNTNSAKECFKGTRMYKKRSPFFALLLSSNVIEKVG